MLEVEYEDEQDFEPYNEPLPTVKNMSDKELQKEMIRQTMSELGKRSAAARAKKKKTK